MAEWHIAFRGEVKCRRHWFQAFRRPLRGLQSRCKVAANARGAPGGILGGALGGKTIGGGDMPIEDDDRPRKKISHEIGQDLSLLSVEELTERIALLTSEIERLQTAAAKKRASKDAANSIFKS
jgi:uncharacterized small protein (DUF1192 family)